MNSLELQFRRYVIDLLVEYLSSLKRNGGAEITREEVLNVLPWGQVTRTPTGTRTTKRQANLLPRPGAETNVITVHGKRYVGALRRHAQTDALTSGTLTRRRRVPRPHALSACRPRVGHRTVGSACLLLAI